jgi:cyclopropane fatty-acyl-phospholipid synthase-like methyltransferase
MRQPHPSSAEFFETKYGSAPDGDPWQFATADYEQRRYDTVMRVLQGKRYSHGLEPGCSVGVLTERLATVCDALDAFDFSPTATAIASARCASLPGVTVRCAGLTNQEAWHTFDLVVLCEIGYYFTATAWEELVKRMTAELQSGDAVHSAFRHPLLQQTLSERHEGFLLERWTKSA